MAELDKLLAVMEKLRSEDGCPWDRVQTHQTLRTYLLEETYEVLEAIDGGQPQKLCGELGDLLLQIIFHAQLAKEAGQFTIEDVISAVTEKMVNRHPHVFGETNVNGVQDVLVNWEKIKKQEEGMKERSSVLDGIPVQLPALMQAAKIQTKASRVGFDWDQVDGAFTKVTEELKELSTAIEHQQQAEIEEDLFTSLRISAFSAFSFPIFKGTEANELYFPIFIFN